MSTRTFTIGPVYVEWWPDHEPHGHQVVISIPGEVFTLDGYAVEDYATELADAVARCNESRHQGHGRTHALKDTEDAFKAAIQQLQDRDYDKEWEDQERRQRFHKLWGGPAPAAVLFFDADKELRVALTDPRTGLPSIYRPSKSIQELLPKPDFSTAHIDPSGAGWVRKRQLKPHTKWRRLKK